MERASLAELKNGYCEEPDGYRCLACGRSIEKGVVYEHGSVLYEAQRYIRIHIEETHGSMFEFLIHLDKRFTGLTEHQNKLLRLFYLGKSDEEIKRDMQIGSTATIRNHRFVLKEKERQARLFLTLMELLKAKKSKPTALIPPSASGTMIDGRHLLSDPENERILKKYFPHGLNGPLQTLHMKEKSKLAVLRQIAQRFAEGRFYSEKEVNEILKSVYVDYVALRRSMIEYGFMKRLPDGSRYWLKESARGTEEEDGAAGRMGASEGGEGDAAGKSEETEDQGFLGDTGEDEAGERGVGLQKDEGADRKNEAKEREDEKVDQRGELKAQYKEMKTEAGVYQIRNTKNGKMFVVATPNLKTINGKVMQLEGGGHTCKELQQDWNLYGEKAFVFEVLEVLKEKEEGYFDKKEELKKLEAKWLERLQPYGGRGYNRPKKGL
ncbi:GIY-YIG nuclease superfamily [Acididesulfobacillus acetoxydans]|uniref:GIY-YIG nuclease superfamily n=1 Tax=Acididesulfobacillus acetoxydans TaxID=1561005 RepID=A0A8S0WGY0_9FIRM|nr:DUF2087 domain-containing protein [Acididesulfobacillus acetoxydans]CAA7602292.1 GIY-YIG nuclease superfamily [Acididesulfobacillus acetoxydans]CEJ07490.1 LuxR transcriptional regulator [Acididesulfobacillus acetoxydans]